MRRIGSSFFIAGGWLVAVFYASTAVRGDDARTSLFRELTNERPANRPVQMRHVEQVSTRAAVATSQAAPTQRMAARQTRPQAAPYSPLPAAAQAARQASFYGGTAARQTMEQFPKRAAIRSNPRRATHRQPKPFETVEHEPTISPYLNLDREDADSQDVPYLTLVLPQLAQMQTNRAQQQELQQLRGQVQSMSAPVGTPAGMGSSARFMDTAQFYGMGR